QSRSWHNWGRHLVASFPTVCCRLSPLGRVDLTALDCLRQRDAVQEQAAELMVLCTQHGLPLYLVFGTTLYGRACAAQGQLALGMVQMQQGITRWRSMGAERMRTYMLALLADAYREAGQMQEGVVVLTEAMSLVAEKGERWWEAELYRLKGE